MPATMILIYQSNLYNTHHFNVNLILYPLCLFFISFLLKTLGRQREKIVDEIKVDTRFKKTSNKISRTGAF